MTHDLRTILDGWEYDPGKISVRKIIGQDGREKIQTRIDLGVLQIEPAGRPDGKRPQDCDSLLDHLEERLVDYVHKNNGDEGFLLTTEECRELRHEAYLYYQRYVSLFVLGEYDGVERDTQRNLRVLDFCHRYASVEADRAAMEVQRAYVLMMNTRSKAYRALQSGAYEAALRIVKTGIAHVRQITGTAPNDPATETVVELRVLAELQNEVLEKMPNHAPAKLQWQLQSAVEREDYERAAALRDQLAAQQRRRRCS